MYCTQGFHDIVGKTWLNHTQIYSKEAIVSSDFSYLCSCLVVSHTVTSGI